MSSSSSSRPVEGGVAATATRPVYALGEAVRVAGFALAGATVMVAEDRDSVLRFWGSIPDDSVVVLTPYAAAVLSEGGIRLEGRLRAVMPA